jgi:CRISPR-associated endonuclease Cas2
MLRAYLLSYDIGDARRLRLMHRLAKAHGRALQYSVFTCLLTAEQRVRLAQRVDTIIDRGKDRVVILDLGVVRDRETWIPPVEIFGRQELQTDPRVVIV